MSLEVHFSRLENDTGLILKKLLSIVFDLKQLPTLSTNADSVLKLFIYYQMRRTPDVLDALEAPGYFEQNFKQTTEMMILDNPDIVHSAGFVKLQSHDEQKVLFSQSRIKAIATRDSAFFRGLQNKHLSLAVATGNSCFIVSSEPVHVFTPSFLNTNPSLEDLENDPYIQYFFPIHRKVVLLYRGLYWEPQILHWGTKTVRQFNKAIARQSSMIAAHNQALVQSLLPMVNQIRLKVMQSELFLPSTSSYPLASGHVGATTQ